MSKLVLYGVETCPPVRACKLTLAALGLKYEYKLVDIVAGEQRTKEYFLKNPQRSVPTLEDDGKFIWESHAICAYLVRRYAKDDALYPKDYFKRALVDQRLHFESGVLFQGCIRSFAAPLVYKNETEIPRSKIDEIFEAYDFLESFIGNQPYLCGSGITIADYSMVSSVSSLVGLAPIDSKRYPKLSGWLERMSSLPNYHSLNGDGAQKLIDMFNSRITKIG
ncbi:glutathione S-transferase 1-like [Drosophila rhopaloa]|uniref:Glutathione S-transferase 1-like n=1 Tax=Drosophila rhopaloa TaxID=1041015 RepID=A0A6P4F3B2_DRORH|nr:glutathione S-transferase 1-like [Drosophila rhopaloa]